jgi:hypothetical protein
MDENEILEQLVVEEKDLAKQLAKLVEQAGKVFKIERPSGRIVFEDFIRLSDKERILVLLIGKYFAGRLKIIEDAAMSISEIGSELGRPMTALSGPVRDLVKAGLVEHLPGRRYKVEYHRINHIFEQILVPKIERRN